MLPVRIIEIEYSYCEGMNDALYCCSLLIFDYKLNAFETVRKRLNRRSNIMLLAILVDVNLVLVLVQ